MYTLTISDPSKLFFTSDSHFGHFGIVHYCDRPFGSRKDMNEGLIERWNSVVPDDGIVIHCGDFMLPHEVGVKQYLKIMSRLKGNILLCRGNHDRIELCGHPQQNLIAVVDIGLIKVGDIKIMASHYPMLAFPADYQVFGHVHTRADGSCSGPDADVPGRLRTTQYDVGVDQNEYTPVSFYKLLEIWNG